MELIGTRVVLAVLEGAVAVPWWPGTLHGGRGGVPGGRWWVPGTGYGVGGTGTGYGGTGSVSPEIGSQGQFHLRSVAQALAPQNPEK